jgi:hypothetical protein
LGAFKKKHISETRRKEELQALITIICAVTLPLILAIILVAAEMRPDLSDLMPSEALPDQDVSLIGWPDLEIPEGRSVSLEQARWQPRRRVRMLGYMVDGFTADEHKPAQKGAQIAAFTLLPEAGQFLHPAHRIPDQMVEIRLAHNALFEYRSLVWATGTLARTAARLDGDQALYAMTDAGEKPAVQSDITLWFKP